jgi:signal transduction histidine kinase
MIDDDEDQMVLVRAMLRGLPDFRFELEWKNLFDEGLRTLLEQRHDVCLLDHYLGPKTGLDLLREAASRQVKVPIVMLTGTGSIEVDREAMRLGAADYLDKDRLDVSILERALRYALERARSREALERQARDLARSNAELQRFAHVASHDLRQPLHTIGLLAEMLQTDLRGQIPDESARMFHDLRDAVQRTQDLISDLLAYTRVGAEVRPRAELDTGALLDEVVADLRGAIAQAGGTVTRGELPPVVADRTLLKQLLQNLIGNALKFRAVAPPEVRVSATPQAEGTRFSVADNGVGVSERDRARVFGMFQRGAGTEQVPGTGMGLAICQKIVELHGGRIWLESERGRGSTFHFTLPPPPPTSTRR